MAKDPQQLPALKAPEMGSRWIPRSMKKQPLKVILVSGRHAFVLRDDGSKKRIRLDRLLAEYTLASSAPPDPDPSIPSGS